MALRLRIVSEQSNRLGPGGSMVFGVHGGTIGRAAENEWILPDPERYLSGKHARVDFRAGTYYLVDTSSNGTYVNGAQIPLGKYHEYGMRDGDLIRIGEYEMLVSIDASNDFPPDEGASGAYDGGDPAAAVKTSTSDDIGADLDLSDLLESSGQLRLESSLQVRNAYGQPVVPSEDPATAWHMMTRPLKVDRPPPPRGAPLPVYDGDVDAGLAAFCRGAGIDPRSMPPDARTAALQLAGQLLREAVLGLMDLRQSRAEFRNQFRMPSGPEAAEEAERAGPIKFTQSVDDTLLKLLTTVSVRAGSVEAMRDVFRDMKSQNTATLTALRVALEDLLKRFDPGELAERFERGAKRGVFGAQNKAKYWELYTDLFTSLSQCPPEGFPHLFAEAFAKAYEAKLRTLIPPRRGAFGGDAEPGYDSAVKVSGDL
jgi:type VI secretion system protein